MRESRISFGKVARGAARALGRTRAVEEAPAPTPAVAPDPTPAPFDLSVLRVAAAGDDRLVVCGVERFPLDFDASDLRVCAFATDGSLMTDRFVDLGTSIQPDRRYPSKLRLSASFSLRLPAGCDSCVLQVAFAGASHSITLGAAQMAEQQGAWALLTTPADRDIRYEDWFLSKHRAQANELELQRLAVPQLTGAPKFSLVVPLSQASAATVASTVESVRAQTYPHWELLLVNTAPDDAALRRAIETACAADARVRKLAPTGGCSIAQGFGAGIHAATGDFVAFANAGDSIEPDLLYHYAEAINRRPTTDMLYCDEDSLVDGHHTHPLLKPDWDIDLLCAENYVSHLLAVRKNLVTGLCEPPEGILDGALCHHLAFVAGEQAREVYHVPRVLYHSCGQSRTPGTDPTAQKAQLLAVQDHLDRCGIPATAVADSQLPGHCRLDYRFDQHALVSIIIPNKDSAKLLDQCLTSLLADTTWPNLEIVVVENNSTDAATFAFYEQLPERDPRIRVVSSHTGGVFNFSKVINDGVAAARGDYLLFLNNDIEVMGADWLEQLMGPCMRADIGAVGCKLVYPDDTYQHVGVGTGRGTSPFHIDINQPATTEGYLGQDLISHRVSAVTGACLLTKRSAFDEVDGLDEKLSVNFNDIDFCLRLQKRGYGVLFQPSCCLRHYESLTRGPTTSQKQALARAQELGLYGSRWVGPLVHGDPFYSRNFHFMNAYRRLDA